MIRIAWVPIIVLLVLFFGGYFNNPPQEVYPGPVNKTIEGKDYCDLGKLQKNVIMIISPSPLIIGAAF